MDCNMNARIQKSSALDDIVALQASARLDRTTFWRRVNGLTKIITQHPAQRWALICEDSAWFATGLFALANNRRIIVLPQAPMAGSLNASKTRVDAILSDRHEACPGIELLTMSADMTASSTTPALPGDAACIEFHTSGSTGMPKCIPKTFAQLRHEVETLEQQWGGRFGDALIIGTVPHYHLYGLLFRILWPILSGRPFQSSVCLHLTSLRAAAARTRCVIVSSPTFLSRIDNPSDLPLASQVPAIFSSGAPLADETARMLAQDWGRAVIEVYGSTETGGVAWRTWSGPHNRPLWQPFHGVEISLREENAGNRLWVRSSNTWRDEWVATGDLAQSSDNGQLVLLGRADDVIKFADKRISLTEMRMCLMTHAWVQDARLLLIQGHRTLIGAVVVLNTQGQDKLMTSGKTKIRDALRTWLRSSYEPVMIPRKWRFIETLPETDMGKVSHQRLQQLFEPQP
jgi:acyl-coenzyme A synthetase/AMP-(fatty) acid ligase